MNAKMILNCFVLTAVAVCGVGLSSVAQADLNTVESDIAAGGAPGDPFTPSFPSGGVLNNDLLNGLLPVFSTGDFTREDSTGLSALTDGTFDTQWGDGTPASSHTAWATAGAGDSVLYNLAGPSALSEVVIYGGWNDGGRDQQSYEVFISTNGVDFTSIGDVDTNPGLQGVDLGPIGVRVSFTPAGGGLFASNVTNLRVDFRAVENGYVGIAEIDAIGTTAAIPEPGTAALLGLGMVGLSIVRRRRS